MEVVALAVTKAQRAVRAGGRAEWGFWDVKGGFQNVRWEPVRERLEEYPEGRRWLPWLANFFGRRDFEVARMRYSTTILHQTLPLLINDNAGIIRFYSYLFLLSQAQNLSHVFLLHHVWAIPFSLRHCYTLLP